MGTGEQLITIAAVLLGALTTHVTTFLMERSRNKYLMLTRWDDRKLTAYEGFIDAVRTTVYLSVELYEHKNGLREATRPEVEVQTELVQAMHLRGRAFERVMLMAGDEVIEAGHQLGAAALQIDWQALGKVDGTLDEWRKRHRTVFSEINDFHEAARRDLGVQGSVKGEHHPARDLLLPSARRQHEENRRPES